MDSYSGLKLKRRRTIRNEHCFGRCIRFAYIGCPRLASLHCCLAILSRIWRRRTIRNDSMAICSSRSCEYSNVMDS